MNYTNKNGLSDLMFDMVVKSMSNYSSGGSQYSTTKLIDPPRKVRLQKDLDDKVSVDVSDLMPAFLGNAVHDYLERLAPPDAMSVEDRFFVDVDGISVSGQVDIIPSSGDVGDYKTIKSWSLIFGDVYDKWFDQLNINAWLARQNGINVSDTGFIEYFILDWKKGQADVDRSYPQKAQGRVEFKLLSPDKQEALVYGLVRKHEEAKKDLPFCTDKERWKKPDEWKLFRKNGKRALKKEATLDALLEWALKKGHAHEKRSVSGATIELKRGFYTKFVKGEYTRCLSYCTVADWCTQWKEDSGGST